jgi:hypothetical protein
MAQDVGPEFKPQYCKKKKELHPGWDLSPETGDCSPETGDCHSGSILGEGQPHPGASDSRSGVADCTLLTSSGSAAICGPGLGIRLSPQL